MLDIKIYEKRGRSNYKENNMVREIKEALHKKYASEPESLKNFIPAKNIEELQNLHREYCSQEVDYEEVKSEPMLEKTEEEHKKFRDEAKKTIQPNNDMEGQSFIDPLNQSNPIVRDYVMDEKFESTSQNSEPKKTSFEEPTTFKDAFKMPEFNNQSGKTESKKVEKEQPINPNYNEQSSGRKKRTNKKFAKYIVEAVCMLAQKGFMWWSTKDITEAKIAQYELNNEIDLSVLLTMPDGQQSTVKEWFKAQEFTAKHLSQFEEKEKEDLAEALAELLDKKGVSPSIEQEIAIIALKMFGQKAMIAIEMRNGINSVLEQLKSFGGTNTKTINNEIQGYDETQPQQTAPIVEKFNSEKNSVVEEIENNFADIAIIEEQNLNP